MDAHSPRKAALNRDRVIVAAGLGGLIVLSWIYLVPTALDMYGSMSGPSAWMMAATWDARYFVLVFLMWCVMMVGMMLPSAAPMILLFAAVQRSAHAEAPIARTYAFVAGYLAAWTAFSLAATILQGLLARAALMSPMMEYTNATIGALTLMAAGIYQWTPLKRLCLIHCRSPLHWLSHGWRRGVGGALGMGASHGSYCVGCCWVLMLLLFFGGVMNLMWIALIAGFVLLEKLAPFGVHVARIGGALLVAAGVWLLV